MTIHTKRLDIKEMVFSDALNYYNYAKDKEVASLAGFKPVSSLETAKNIVIGAMYRGDTYSIYLKDTDTFIGTCNTYQRGVRTIKDVLTLGISLDKKYWSFGFGTETILALVKYCFKHKKTSVLEMTAFVDNMRSRKMIEKVGFKLDGIIKRYGKLYDNTIYDIALYSYFKEDYEEMEKWKKY